MTFQKTHAYWPILVFVFFSNFIWEISQMVLYDVHYQGLQEFIIAHVAATLGDLIIFAVIYVFGLLIFRNRNWVYGDNKAKYVFVILAGVAVSVAVEKWALMSGRWSYDQLMPIIPVLNVGLTPVLQMIVLPLTTVIFWQRISMNK